MPRVDQKEKRQKRTVVLFIMMLFLVFSSFLAVSSQTHQECFNEWNSLSSGSNEKACIKFYSYIFFFLLLAVAINRQQKHFLSSSYTAHQQLIVPTIGHWSRRKTPRPFGYVQEMAVAASQGMKDLFIYGWLISSSNSFMRWLSQTHARLI